MSTHTAPIEQRAHAGASPAHGPDRERGLCLPLCRAQSVPPHHRLRNSSALRFDVAELLAGPSPDCQSLHPHRRDGPRPGDPVHRPQLQPARGRSADLSHRLGELSLHHQPRHHREEVSAQLLLPLAGSRLAIDGRRQPESSCLAGGRRAGRVERCSGAERHHHVDVRGDGSGRTYRAWNGTC